MNEKVAKQLNALRVIVGTMAMGVIGFSVVAVVVTQSGDFKPVEGMVETLLPVLAAVAFFELPAYFVIRNGAIKRCRKDWSDEVTEDEASTKITQIFSTSTIIGAAMLEGLGLFGALIVLITGNLAILAVPGIAIVLLAVCSFPMIDKLRSLKARITGRSA